SRVAVTTLVIPYPILLLKEFRTSTVRWVVTRALQALGWIRSLITWTTQTTLVCSSSHRARSRGLETNGSPSEQVSKSIVSSESLPQTLATTIDRRKTNE